MLQPYSLFRPALAIYCVTRPAASAPMQAHICLGLTSQNSSSGEYASASGASADVDIDADDDVFARFSMLFQ
jgi:hypothetical protein